MSPAPSLLLPPSFPFIIFLYSFLLVVYLPLFTPSTIFNFSSFPPNSSYINFSGDAFTSGENVIQLTRNQLDNNLLQSSGRAVYSTPVKIWDAKTQMVTDFVTHFEFMIKGLDGDHYGDGPAFFIAPVGSELPQNSTGQWLGLFNSTTNNLTSNKLVAVDTFKNDFDPDGNNVGINVNSIVSVTNINWKTEIKNGSRGSAWIGYNSNSKSLFVYLTYKQGDSYNGVPCLSYNFDLTTVLPETVIVGFSASTGSSTELHKILSWDFITNADQSKSLHKRSVGRVVVLVLVLIIFIDGLDYIAFLCRKVLKKKKGGTGPRRFS